MHQLQDPMSSAPPLAHSGSTLGDESDDAAKRLLVGCSIAMVRIRAIVRQVATAKIPVLIVGPTGAGKELVARALHAVSRRSGELVALNVCAVAESMFEATLFGHVKGAFTGAVDSVNGYFAEANGGTLFLDEISGLPLASQVKLLRALETGTYRPVRGSCDRQSQFRLITATNEELPSRVAAGTFRGDLYYRLAGFLVRVPALAERREDIRLLVQHFLLLGGHARVQLTSSATLVLEEHAWPGNIRELRHVVERLALLAGTAGTVTRELAEEALAVSCEDTRTFPASRCGESRAILLDALARADWNIDVAGNLLGVDRATVYRRMKREGIRVPDDKRRRRKLGGAAPMQM